MTGQATRYGERGEAIPFEHTFDGYRRFKADRERRKAARAAAEDRARRGRENPPALVAELEMRDTELERLHELVGALRVQVSTLGAENDGLRGVIARGGVHGWSLVGGRAVRVPGEKRAAA